ncbi:MAG: Glycerophosphoryl diester phosphodiesterase [Betaproteobacteria bacterium]|nr:Glycerophosphoryl diester phosphodiesterase [Betaproteobacteria bacterium]
MLLFAHRGFHVHSPENSLAAFEAAVKLGVDGIETDVRLSRDGLPVIIHDRVTPARRAVAELTHREIESDAGHPVPLLADILDAFPDVLWNIEIKNPEVWPAASKCLARFQHSRRLFVTSFRHDVVRRCAEELATDCGLLVAHRPLEVAAMMAECADQPRIKSIVWDYNIADDGMLKSVGAGGWQNFIYGAVTPAEHERCRDLGLSGLITDYPPLVLAQRA